MTSKKNNTRNVQIIDENNKYFFFKNKQSAYFGLKNFKGQTVEMIYPVSNEEVVIEKLKISENGKSIQTINAKTSPTFQGDALTDDIQSPLLSE
ncbi:MAG: hypothetical protein IBX55_01245 [Methyloprofundus sp.]|nr:hypothetical protein [Methyloprofundus sp.]